MKQLKKLNLILNVLSALYPKTTNALKVFGAIVVLKKIVTVLTSLCRCLLRRPKNLIKRYGEGSWVFITGSSEGIGKAIASEFAQKGFNIILSARTKAKLEAAKEELQAQFSGVEVRTLAVDYSHSTEPSFIKDKLRELEGLDISVLVNNVGVDVLNYYHRLSEEEILRLVNINCGACSVLSHQLIPHFLSRPSQSAIINVASLAG